MDKQCRTMGVKLLNASTSCPCHWQLAPKSIVITSENLRITRKTSQTLGPLRTKSHGIKVMNVPRKLLGWTQQALQGSRP
eukprot:5040753-Amphidinium_carterae.1